VVSFTAQTLYPQGKSPQYPLDRRLGWSQNRSGHGGGEEKILGPRRESNPRTMSRINKTDVWRLKGFRLLTKQVIVNQF